jgi:hypothetical protein
MIRNVQVSDPTAFGISLMEAADAAAARTLLDAAEDRSATTDLEGQVELATQAEMDAGTAGKVVTADLNMIALDTPTTTTSGTAHDYAIPEGTREVTMVLAAVSLDGTEELLFQVADSGGFYTTGYVGGVASGAGTDANHGASTGFLLRSGSGAADDSFHGVVRLSLLNESTNKWVVEINVGTNNNLDFFHGAGYITLSNPLEQVRLTSTGTPDDFNAGEINVLTKR